MPAPKPVSEHSLAAIRVTAKTHAVVKKYADRHGLSMEEAMRQILKAAGIGR